MDDPIVRLKAWQPEAANIETAECDVCGGLLLSYILGEPSYRIDNHTVWQECGFWCSDCGFSNAGARTEKGEVDSDG